MLLVSVLAAGDYGSYREFICCAELMGYRTNRDAARDPVIHRCEIRRAGRAIEITDTLGCRGRHAIEQWWHFSERCNVEITGSVIDATNEGASIRLATDSEPAALRIYRGSEDPIAGWVSRRFDVKVPSHSACIRREIRGTTTLRTTIECFPVEKS